MQTICVLMYAVQLVGEHNETKRDLAAKWRENWWLFIHQLIKMEIVLEE